jgi:hypothetical protein
MYLRYSTRWNQFKLELFNKKTTIRVRKVFYFSTFLKLIANRQRCRYGLGESEYRNLSWNDNPCLFSLKIARDLARALLMMAALTVSPPDFQDGITTAHVGGGLFCHFYHFFAYGIIDYIIQFIRQIEWVYSLYGLFINGFISCGLFAALASAAMHSFTCVIAVAGWCSRD